MVGKNHIIGRVLRTSQQTKMEHIPILGKKTFQLPTKMTQNTHPGLPHNIDRLQVYSQLASSQQTHLGGDFGGWFFKSWLCTVAGDDWWCPIGWRPIGWHNRWNDGMIPLGMISLYTLIVFVWVQKNEEKEVPVRSSMVSFSGEKTLQGTNISHLGKRKVIFKLPWEGIY